MWRWRMDSGHEDGWNKGYIFTTFAFNDIKNLHSNIQNISANGNYEVYTNNFYLKLL